MSCDSTRTAVAAVAFNSFDVVNESRSDYCSGVVQYCDDKGLPCDLIVYVPGGGFYIPTPGSIQFGPAPTSGRGCSGLNCPNGIAVEDAFCYCTSSVSSVNVFIRSGFNPRKLPSPGPPGDGTPGPVGSGGGVSGGGTGGSGGVGGGSGGSPGGVGGVNAGGLPATDSPQGNTDSPSPAASSPLPPASASSTSSIDPITTSTEALSPSQSTALSDITLGSLPHGSSSGDIGSSLNDGHAVPMSQASVSFNGKAIASTPTQASSSDSTTTSSSTAPSKEVIIGVSVGAVIVIFLALAALYLIRRRRANKGATSVADGTASDLSSLRSVYVRTRPRGYSRNAGASRNSISTQSLVEAGGAFGTRAAPGEADPSAAVAPMAQVIVPPSYAGHEDSAPKVLPTKIRM